MNVRLEVERALHPREQKVHRLFDLAAHVLMKLFTRERAQLHQQLADALVARFRLRGDGGVELLL